MISVESPSHGLLVDDVSAESVVGVGTASTLDAVGTDGLAISYGGLRELRGEGPCQAPSLVGSNVTKNATLTPKCLHH